MLVEAAVVAAEGVAVVAAVAVAAGPAAVELEAGPVPAGPVVPVELVPLELVAGRELVAVSAAVTVMKSDPMPIHVDGFTRTTSEQGCFVSKEAKGPGLAAVGSGLVTLGLVEPFLVGITHARPTAVGRSGGRRRTRAVPKGLTTRSG